MLAEAVLTGLLTTLAVTAPPPEEPLPPIVDIGTHGVWATPSVTGTHLVVYTAFGRAFHLDTTVLTGTAARAWWVDPRTGTSFDFGSVPRDRHAVFFPPETGEGDAGLAWVLVVVDADAVPSTPR